jgi:hypothetical protein
MSNQHVEMVERKVITDESNPVLSESAQSIWKKNPDTATLFNKSD